MMLRMLTKLWPRVKKGKLLLPKKERKKEMSKMEAKMSLSSQFSKKAPSAKVFFDVTTL